LTAASDAYHLDLTNGQLERYDAAAPQHMIHTSFETYRITLPINRDAVGPSTRFRNFSSGDLKKMVMELKKQKLPTGPVEAERSLRLAIAFAPLALALMGIPLATALRRGGKGFGFGVSIVVIFTYYTLLIFGLTLAEKGILPSDLALWIANGTCFIVSGILITRLLRQ
jgi:lipopolysaccharide export LptBFGC system permease protein LptF